MFIPFLGGKDSTDIPSEKIKVNASAGTAKKDSYHD